LSGEGELGKNGGRPGDLLIAVRVKPHKIFRREGADIYCDIPISFVTAALGGEIDVPTLDGKVKYKIPEGTQPGTQFKLKGKGIPYIRGYGRGDQYINIIVDIPKGLTQEQKDILRQFEASYYNGEGNEKKSFFSKVKDALGG
jgi:DnaJ C terminal region.